MIIEWNISNWYDPNIAEGKGTIRLNNPSLYNQMIIKYLIYSCIISFYVQDLKAQIIKLEEFWIYCSDTKSNNKLDYIPYEFAFNFKIINNTSKALFIGAENFYADKNAKYGYFEIKINGLDSLKLRTNYPFYSLSPNMDIIIKSDSFKVYANQEWKSDDFISRNFKSFLDIYNCILSCDMKLYFYSIESDYNIKSTFQPFPTMEVDINDGYFILAINDIGHLVYRIEKNDEGCKLIKE